MLLKKHGLACWLNIPRNPYYGNFNDQVCTRQIGSSEVLFTDTCFDLFDFFFLFFTREYFGEKIGIYFAWLGRALLLFMKSFLLLLVPSFGII